MQKYNPIFFIPIVYLIAGLITYYTFPTVNKIALKFGFVDNPNSRKQHNKPVSRIGGVTIILGFIISILIGIYFDSLINYSFPNSNQYFLIIFGSILMFSLGLIDDLKGLSPWSRLISQFLISSILWSNGLSINQINLDNLGIAESSLALNPFFSYFFSVIWLVGITNAFNWIDGLDGLAAGIAGITSLSFAVIFHKIDVFEFIYLSTIIGGCCLGFLKNNFYPAKIFMGDGGAYFLGFSLGAIAICDIGSNLTDPIFTSAIIILFLPLSDMALVILRRVLQGKSPFYPDKSHFHHFLLNIGFNHKQTVILLYFLTCFFSIVGLILTDFNLLASSK